MTSDRKKPTPRYETWKDTEREREKETKSKSSQGREDRSQLQKKGLRCCWSSAGRQMLEEQYPQSY